MITLKKCVEITSAKLINGIDLTFKGVSTDSRSIKPGELFVAIKGENFDGNQFAQAAAVKGAAAVLVSARVDVQIPQLIVADTIKAFGQLARWHREQFDIPVIAVTGSCGKTKAKAMLASIFSGLGKTLSPVNSFNNDIGLPLTLLQLDDTYRTVVLELGANHPGEIANLVKNPQPHVAAITMVAPVHLEGFGTVENIAAAKGEIFNDLPADGVAVVNADDPLTKLWQEQLAGKRVIRFGRQMSAEVSAKDITVNPQGCAEFTLLTPAGEIRINLPVLGEHNINPTH